MGIDIKEIYWIAAFLEGEGYFGWQQNKWSGELRLMANQVQKWPLEKLKKLVGGKIYLARVDSYPIYVWTASSPRRAASIMMTIYHLMSPKRKRKIKKVLRVWRKSPKHGDWERRKTRCPYGHPYSKENTYLDVSTTGKISRKCKICTRLHNKLYRDVRNWKNW